METKLPPRQRQKVFASWKQSFFLFEPFYLFFTSWKQICFLFEPFDMMLLVIMVRKGFKKRKEKKWHKLIWGRHSPTPHLKLKHLIFSTCVSQKARKYSNIWQKELFQMVQKVCRKIETKKCPFLIDTHPPKTNFSFFLFLFLNLSLMAIFKTSKHWIW